MFDWVPFHFCNLDNSLGSFTSWTPQQRKVCENGVLHLGDHIEIYRGGKKFPVARLNRGPAGPPKGASARMAHSISRFGGLEKWKGSLPQGQTFKESPAQREGMV